jgi:hypothetical protein
MCYVLLVHARGGKIQSKCKQLHNFQGRRKPNVFITAIQLDTEHFSGYRNHFKWLQAERCQPKPIYKSLSPYNLCCVIWLQYVHEILQKYRKYLLADSAWKAALGDPVSAKCLAGIGLPTSYRLGASIHTGSPLADPLLYPK